MAEKQKVCCVCGDSKEVGENQLFTCKGHGCDVIVHRACYGIVSVPTGLWFCRKCESQERAARVRCELCPKKEGALKRTDSGGWAHVICALYIPEATFGNNRTMEPIITSKLPKEKFSKPCYVCEEAGLETQATHGACMYCHKSSCRLAFHVTCGQKEHLLCEEPDPRDPNNVVYCGYCHNHYKKMVRQKRKQQSGRKQSSSERPAASVLSTSTLPYPSAPVPYAHSPQLPLLPFQLPISISSISPPLSVNSVQLPVQIPVQLPVQLSASTQPSIEVSPPYLQRPALCTSEASVLTTTTGTSNIMGLSQSLPAQQLQSTSQLSLPPISLPPISLPPISLPPISLPPSSHPPSSHPPISHPPSSHPPISHSPSSHPPISHPPSSHPPISHPPSSHPLISHPPSSHPPPPHSTIHPALALPSSQTGLHPPPTSLPPPSSLPTPSQPVVPLVPSSQPNVLASTSLSFMLPIQIPASFHSQSIPQAVPSVSQSLQLVSQNISQVIPSVSQPSHALFQLAFPQPMPHFDTNLNKVGQVGQRRAKKSDVPAAVPQKRVAMDTPMPSTKRKCRRRKLSSSNDSTTSEVLPVTSDVTQVPRPPPTTAVPSGAQSIPTPRVDGSSSVQPLSPPHTADNGGGRLLGPPMSLQELLERQWEQTAQFIIHQAGQQNNAGVMLAHLHQLQSENRRMQARIMELASQREFYIATNTRLHQTLTEHDLSGGNKLTNGVHPQGEGSLRGPQSAASSAQVSPVAAPVPTQHISEGTRPAGVVRPTHDPAPHDLHIGTVETALLKVAHGRLLLGGPGGTLLGGQGSTLADLEQLGGAGGRMVTLRGMPDVTHVTDSIQTPISTFAALPVGNMPQWCD